MNAFEALLKLVLDKNSLTQAQNTIKNTNFTANVKVDSSGVNKMASEISRLTKANTIQAWADNNTKAMRKFGNEIVKIIGEMKNLNSPMTQDAQNQLMKRFKEIQLSSRETKSLGKGIFGSIKDEMTSFARWAVSSALIMKPIQQMREAISVMKEVDKELVNIQKVTKATADEMKNLTKEAYSMATQYGRSPTEFLKSVTAFSRAGYGDTASKLGELSLLAQNVGDINEETADKFLIATDAAWKYKGSAEELTKVLDGFNELSNKTATNVNSLAEGITVGGSVFAQAGLSAKDYAGIVGTATAKTQRSGDEIARAWRTILMNIRQIKGTDIETGEIIDEDSLYKAEKALNAVGIQIREIINGQNELRNPMQILTELANKWANLSSVQQSAIQEALAGRLLPGRIEICA